MTTSSPRTNAWSGIPISRLTWVINNKLDNPNGTEAIDDQSNTFWTDTVFKYWLYNAWTTLCATATLFFIHSVLELSFISFHFISFHLYSCFNSTVQFFIFHDGDVFEGRIWRHFYKDVKYEVQKLSCCNLARFSRNCFFYKKYKYVIARHQRVKTLWDDFLFQSLWGKQNHR